MAFDISITFREKYNRQTKKHTESCFLTETAVEQVKIEHVVKSGAFFLRNDISIIRVQIPKVRLVNELRA